jgi:hypothetical protein
MVLFLYINCKTIKNLIHGRKRQFFSRSLSCEVPFEGAESNLRKLLDKNAAEYDRLIRKQKDSHLQVLPAAEETERCVVFLLKLVDVFVFGENGKASSADIMALVNLLLVDFEDTLRLKRRSFSCVKGLFKARNIACTST